VVVDGVRRPTTDDHDGAWSRFSSKKTSMIYVFFDENRRFFNENRLNATSTSRGVDER